MTVAELMKQRPAFSFEVFPPKTEAGMTRLMDTLEHLYAMHPDYISCTYGAGGTNVGKNLDVLRTIQSSGKTTALTHFTCIGSTRDGVRQRLQSYLYNGICHLLALRGDLPLGWTGTGGELQHANELVQLVRAEFGDQFCIAVAGSPEGHVESDSLEQDIEYLKRKQDAGANYIMTQLCFDMDAFSRWMDAIRDAGIWLPVDAGIMPVLDSQATINMCLSRNACAIPRPLARLITNYWIFPGDTEETSEDKKAAFREAGIAYTIDQIQQYRKCDVAGFHLYALNRYEAVQRIAQEAGLLK